MNVLETSTGQRLEVSDATLEAVIGAIAGELDSIRQAFEDKAGPDGEFLTLASDLASRQLLLEQFLGALNGDL